MPRLFPRAQARYRASRYANASPLRPATEAADAARLGDASLLTAEIGERSRSVKRDESTSCQQSAASGVSSATGRRFIALDPERPAGRESAELIFRARRDTESG